MGKTNVRGIRRRFGMSVSELSEVLQVSESTIYKWEEGYTVRPWRINLQRIHLLENSIGIDLDVLWESINMSTGHMAAILMYCVVANCKPAVAAERLLGREKKKGTNNLWTKPNVSKDARQAAAYLCRICGVGVQQ